MTVPKNLIYCRLSNETRRVTNRLRWALIVRRFAAEYALSQASGVLLRYRSDCRERNFAILDLFLPLRSRARCAFLHIIIPPGSFSLSRNYSLLLSSSRECRVDRGAMSGIRVRHASLT